jgi:hypothetical protein
MKQNTSTMFQSLERQRDDKEKNIVPENLVCRTSYYVGNQHPQVGRTVRYQLITFLTTHTGLLGR